MLLAFHTPRHETNMNLYTHHFTPPCSLRVSPARALRRTPSRDRSWDIGVSPILESLSKGMGSIRRSTRRLARLRHTKVNPAVDSDFPRSTTALFIVYHRSRVHVVGRRERLNLFFVALAAIARVLQINNFP